jgi:site-specific DNA recombinase
MSMTKAVAYLRMSDKKQDKSIPAQRAEIERYAVTHDYSIVRWYSDEGISGAENEKRVGFQQLISDAQSIGDFRAIIVWDQDRFSRFDPMEANHYWYLLRQSGVKIVTVAKGELDFSTLGAWITASVTQHGKNEYLRDLSRNVLRGRLAKARKGKWQHNRAPFGYRIINGGDLVADDGGSADTVREIFRLYAEEDSSYWQIAHIFNSRGVKSPTGKPWTSSAVGLILRRDCYVTGQVTQLCNPKGKFNRVVNGEIVAAERGDRESEGITLNCPTLVSRETWDRSRQFMVKRKSQTSYTRMESRSVLTGMMHCANCGAKMYAGDRARGKSADPTERTYWCSTYHHQGTHACTRNLVHESAILGLLIPKLQEAILNPLNVERLKKAIEQKKAKPLRSAINIPGMRKRLTELDREIAAAVKELKRTPDDLYDLAVDDLRTLRKERERVCDTLTADDAASTRGKVESAKSVSDALARIKRLTEALTSAEPRTVRYALGELVERIDLWFDRIPGKKMIRSALKRGRIKFKESSQLVTPANQLGSRLPGIRRVQARRDRFQSTGGCERLARSSGRQWRAVRGRGRRRRRPGRGG